MMKTGRVPVFGSIYAKVVKCQYRKTLHGLGYWSLKLYCCGALIEAYHWDNPGWVGLCYRDGDELLVCGVWTAEERARLQILTSQLTVRGAANDPVSFTM